MVVRGYPRSLPNMSPLPPGEGRVRAICREIGHLQGVLPKKPSPPAPLRGTLGTRLRVAGRGEERLLG